MIIGIDPGITGAVAALAEIVGSVYDTPIIEVKKGKKITNEYNPSGMAEIIENLASLEASHVFIEKVGAMPGQGVTSMFGFGKGFGIWLGILAALKVPYTLVTPQAWKKEIMEGIGDKDAARVRAIQLFPHLSGELARKKDIGRADALLIAEYGRRKMK